MPLFSVHTRRDSSATYLVLTGELDLEALPVLDGATKGHVGLAVDLSGLEFCDLAGQRALLRCRYEQGFMLVGAPPCVERLFQMTGHDHLLAEKAPVGRSRMEGVSALLPV